MSGDRTKEQFEAGAGLIDWLAERPATEMCRAHYRRTCLVAGFSLCVVFPLAALTALWVWDWRVVVPFAALTLGLLTIGEIERRALDRFDREIPARSRGGA